MSSWTFFTNHAHVLFCLAADSELRMRDLAVRVGITERATQRIVSELEEAGFLTIERVGRRNRYRVRSDLPLRHPIEARHTVGELLTLIDGQDHGLQ
jgi:DNA-binding Lrp family transcriptional regulator